MACCDMSSAWSSTSFTLSAPSFTLSLMSLTVAVCCSAALAMVLARSFTWPTISVISSTAWMADAVSAWMVSIIFVISSVDFAVCPASSFTSLATTANPLPASPARAASMVAFRANRLVCSAMALITWVTSPIFLELSPSRLITSLAIFALSWARSVTLAVSTTFWAISDVAVAISSVDFATRSSSLEAFRALSAT